MASATPSITTQREGKGNRSKQLTVLRSTSLPANAFLALHAGLLTGVLLEKSEAYKPNKIKNQMLFRDNTMLKVYLSASATSFMILGGLKGLNLLDIPVDKSTTRASTSLVRTLLGGSLFGVGMTLDGSTPVSALVQAGAYREQAIYNLLGGVAGSVAYGFVHNFIEKRLKGVSISSTKGNDTLDKLLNIPFWAAALSFASVAWTVVYLVERVDRKRAARHTRNGARVIYAQPFEDVENEEENEEEQRTPAPARTSLLLDYLKQESWSPILAGAGIGLLQLGVAQLIKNSNIPNSTLTSFAAIGSSISTLLYKCVRAISGKPNLAPPSFFSRFSLMPLNPSVTIRLLADLGIILGSYASSRLSGVRDRKKEIQIHPVNATQKTVAFLSGFLMILGGHIAQAQGTVAELSTAALTTAAGIIGGGIGFALFLEKLREVAFRNDYLEE